MFFSEERRHSDTLISKDKEKGEKRRNKDIKQINMNDETWEQKWQKKGKKIESREGIQYKNIGETENGEGKKRKVTI